MMKCLVLEDCIRISLYFLTVVRRRNKSSLCCLATSLPLGKTGLRAQSRFLDISFFDILQNYAKTNRWYRYFSSADRNEHNYLRTHGIVLISLLC